MLRSSRAYVLYKRSVIQIVAKFTEKTCVSESIFNKVKLETLLKKDSDTDVFL